MSGISVGYKVGMGSRLPIMMTTQSQRPQSLNFSVSTLSKEGNSFFSDSVSIPMETVLDRLPCEKIRSILGLSTCYVSKWKNTLVHTSEQYPGCVIKEIPDDRLHILDGFLYQELIARKLSCAPHVHKVIRAAGKYFIVMDKVDGCTVNEWKSSEKHSLNKILRTFLSILKTIQSINKLGIVHSDLGFENIMIDKVGNPIFIDFDDVSEIEKKTFANPSITVSATFFYMLVEEKFQTLCSFSKKRKLDEFIRERISLFNSDQKNSEVDVAISILSSLFLDRNLFFTNLQDFIQKLETVCGNS